jgi:RES domain
MSSPTSTPAGLSSELRPYGRKVWRLVEGQHRVSTMKLVDSLAEQSILEDLVETTKPAVPSGCQGLDYLLYTPFRYGPYKHGSRFRREGLTPGVFYAAENSRTAAAEKAFYRLLFFAESPNTPWPVNPFECTGFSVEVRSPHSLDLTKPPFDADAAVWRHPVNYGPCQDLADAAREADAEILRYQSARDPACGVCIAVLTCAAFAEASPKDRETWWVGLKQEQGAYAIRESPIAAIEFSRDAFASDPRIAAMQWER